MNQRESQITHYIPEWVLRKFRRPYLYELEILTGKTEIRASKNAGSERDLWPNDIEDRLSEHDNAAARIYREKINGKDRIVLTDTEREAFALWIAHFYVRSPKRLVNIERFLNDENHNREGLIEDLYRDRAASIERIKADNPKAYTDTVAELGQEQADKKILEYYAHYIRTAPEEMFAKAQDVRDHYMRTAGTADYAKILLAYEWAWFSSSYGFVISDDPLVSWHLASRRWEFGIAQEGVEVTMPLTLNLCLCLQKQPIVKKTDIHPISRIEARMLNCRQRLSALKYVYGNTPAMLDFVKTPIVGWP
jgi:hypothetical protein